MPRLLFLALILILFALPVQARENEQATGLIEAKALQKLIKENPEDLLLIDVRTPGEFTDGHIAGAKNINFFGPRFEQDIDALPKDSKIVVYCKSGKRSEGAMQIMQEAGFKDVSSLKGGLNAWQKSGGKVLKE